MISLIGNFCFYNRILGTSESTAFPLEIVSLHPPSSPSVLALRLGNVGLVPQAGCCSLSVDALQITTSEVPDSSLEEGRGQIHLSGTEDAPSRGG